jgi:hypothetical protein
MSWWTIQQLLNYPSTKRYLAIVWVVAILFLTTGFDTPTIVGTWQPEGISGTMVFHQDGTFAWNSVWAAGFTGSDGPRNVSHGGPYWIDKPGHLITQFTELDGGPLLYPEPKMEFRYSVTSDTLVTELITTNKEYAGKIIKYRRVKTSN